MRLAQLGKIVMFDPLDFLSIFFGRHIFWQRAVSLRSYFSFFLSSFVSMLQIAPGIIANPSTRGDSATSYIDILYFSPEV